VQIPNERRCTVRLELAHSEWRPSRAVCDQAVHVRLAWDGSAERDASDWVQDELVVTSPHPHDAVANADGGQFSVRDQSPDEKHALRGRRVACLSLWSTPTGLTRRRRGRGWPTPRRAANRDRDASFYRRESIDVMRSNLLLIQTSEYSIGLPSSR
jgi:hypothetical protein